MEIRHNSEEFLTFWVVNVEIDVFLFSAIFGIDAAEILWLCFLCPADLAINNTKT